MPTPSRHSTTFSGRVMGQPFGRQPIISLRLQCSLRARSSEGAIHHG
jgi:hypothetical protein